MDFAAFRQRLAAETHLLAEWLDESRFPDRPPEGGYEMEAWLIDAAGLPAPANQAVISHLPPDVATPELAQFNLELNGQPQRLQGDALSRMHQELKTHWHLCCQAAETEGLRLLMIGTHPLARKSDFGLDKMSDLKRYQAINEAVFQQRQERPLRLDISGKDQLHHQHRDVMLEAATTSFQIHLRCRPTQAALAYNCSKILSGPLVALSANAPYLFGHDLWAETRIPLFEQSVDVGNAPHNKRVSFGVRYAEKSVAEIFQANLKDYPLLLPECLNEPQEQLAHLRLHNGTIWRWNRPLIGFDEDDSPHIRLEQRVVPAGPTCQDAIANAAFYYGAMAALLQRKPSPPHSLPFNETKANFYACAQQGLQANVTWLEGQQGPVKQLLLHRLLPLALEGLLALGIDKLEADYWMHILQQRVSSGQNGATWQRAWMAEQGHDFTTLVARYHALQQSDQPVHSWPLHP
jgi:gamma-glutamyl:cysteine ligase YbdK (ATP-grasp superfamily)